MDSGDGVFVMCGNEQRRMLEEFIFKLRVAATPFLLMHCRNKAEHHSYGNWVMFLGW